ncbi:MAG: glycosyltransferase [Novosphingobium sp.]|nr:glycosyltransferase [Novosphingobium sp.]
MFADDVVTGVCVTHNTKDLIERSFLSIRKFHPNMKIIIVDGSDNSPKGIECKEYIKSISRDNTISIFPGYNIGHGKGLALGINYVRTPFVLTFDSDIEMLKSPLSRMLDMFEEGTYGVGYTEKADLGGHDFGARPDQVKFGSMKYLHPYFSLIQMREYNKYQPFIHHGAPAVNTMLDIHNRGLSDKVIKEFPGLGHSSGRSIPPSTTWVGSPREFIKHDRDGTNIPIQGTWDKVIDGITFPPKKITSITCTGDRPLTFLLCKKWIEQQTVRPDQWIIVDDGKEPIDTTSLPSFAKYIRREPKPSDPQHTLILNIQTAMNHIAGEKIFFMEDDEYYAPNYIEELSKKLDQYELVGIGRSKYYHLLKATYYQHPNMGHASLAQTAFRSSFLPDVKRVINGDPFFDVRIWGIVNGSSSAYFKLDERVLANISKDGRALIFEDKDNSIYCGMKGMMGRKGIGCGHTGEGEPDRDRQKLKEWIPKDYQDYLNIVKN